MRFGLRVFLVGLSHSVIITRKRSGCQNVQWCNLFPTHITQTIHTAQRNAVQHGIQMLYMHLSSVLPCTTSALNEVLQA